MAAGLGPLAGSAQEAGAAPAAGLAEEAAGGGACVPQPAPLGCMWFCALTVVVAVALSAGNGIVPWPLSRRPLVPSGGLLPTERMNEPVWAIA
jgi:hypothetical protein